MLKFSFFLLLFIIPWSGYYVKTQRFGTFFNPFGINWSQLAAPASTSTSTSARNNEPATTIPNNPCPSVFEYVQNGNITEGEIKLKTSGRDAVVDLVFEANVPGTINSVYKNFAANILFYFILTFSFFRTTLVQSNW
jgi:hypothetical protein